MSTQVLWRPYCFRRFHGNIWNFEPDFNSIVNLCFLKHIHVIIMWNTISLLSFKKDTLKHKQMKKPNQKFYLTVLMTLWLHYWNTCRGFFFKFKTLLQSENNFMLHSNKNIDTSYKYHIYNSKRNKLEILSN